MVRETRYLQIGNIPENTTEDEISEYFKRYGRIQSVKLHPKKENETIHLATVAFTDIKSASTAHRAENKLKNNVLKTDFSEGSATGSVVTRTREPDHFQRTPASSTFPNHTKGLEEVDGFDVYYGPTQFDGQYPQATFPEENRQFQNWGRSRDRTPRGSSVVGGGNFNKFDRSNSWQGSQQRHFPEGQHRTASFEQHSTEKETFERPKAPASPAHSTSQASSRHSSRKKQSPSESSSSSSRSSSSSSSSGSRSRSRSSNSSQSSSRSSVKKKVASTAQKVVPRTEIQDDKNSSQEVPESGEREPHGIYITHLPMRSSGTPHFSSL